MTAETNRLLYQDGVPVPPENTMLLFLGEFNELLAWMQNKGIDFLDGKVSSLEYRDAINRFWQFFDSTTYSEFSDPVDFYKALSEAQGLETANIYYPHELEHLEQIARLSEKYSIPLKGILTITKIKDGLYSPGVRTNIEELLGKVDDDVMREMLREIALGTSEISEGDRLILESQAIDTSGMRSLMPAEGDEIPVIGGPLNWEEVRKSFSLPPEE